LQNQAKNTAIDTKKAQTDVPQYGRFLPICAKDTPHFWSDVYKLGTRARKAQVDLVQGGRSMIEMLGVLAIIGVLSVGGIAGYSKAMTKFKINKTVDEVAQITANIHTLFGSQGDYAGLGCNNGFENASGGNSRCENITLYKKSKLAPDEVFNQDNETMTNPFGGHIYVDEYGCTGVGSADCFAIEITGLPEDACMELSTLDWGANSDKLIAVAVNDEVSGVTPSCDGSGYTGQDNGLVSSCNGSERIYEKVSVSTAASRCQSGSNNLLVLNYR
jgi:Tfp pilus assembly protein PilE